MRQKPVNKESTDTHTKIFTFNQKYYKTTTTTPKCEKYFYTFIIHTM